MNAFVTAALVDLQAADVPITRDNVKPGWVALGIVFALGVGLFLLMRSFAKHSRVARQPWEGESGHDESADSAVDESGVNESSQR